MKQLWTPWRAKYVTRDNPGPGCVLCRVVEERDDPESLVVYRGPQNLIVMNLYPYNSGHLMIVPYAHQATLAAISPESLADMMRQAQLAEAVLSARYRPRGFNVGMNLGRVGGAGIPDHLHLHVVPRWEGDTNFMTVVGEIRVIPEDLPEAARELRKLFADEAR